MKEAAIIISAVVATAMGVVSIVFVAQGNYSAGLGWLAGFTSSIRAAIWQYKATKQ